MKRCSVENCKANYYGRRYCSKHYKRFMAYGDPLGISTKVNGRPPSKLVTALNALEQERQREALSTRALRFTGALIGWGYNSGAWFGDVKASDAWGLNKKAA